VTADESYLLTSAQEAVDATASAYTEDATIDVDDRLVAELDARPVWPRIGAAVVPVLAHYIRSGHPVRLYLDADDHVAVGGVPGADEGVGAAGD
jgi:hypothetical protein